MTLEEIRTKYKDDRFFKEVFETKIYDPVEFTRNKVIVDVGALAGEFSLWMKDNAERIYAIEPDPEQYNELEENVQSFKSIKAFNFALSDHQGVETLFPSHDRRGGYSIIDNDVAGKEVPCMTLAHFMKVNNIAEIDVLKIDIENGEDKVFNAPDFKEVASKIKVIIGEHLDGVGPMLEGLGFTAEDYPNGRIFRR